MSTISFESLSSGQLAGPNGTPNLVAVKVVDASGAALADQALTLSIDNDATLEDGSSAITGALGTVTVTIFSDTAGNANLTATLADGTSASTAVTFVSKASQLSLG